MALVLLSNVGQPFQFDGYDALASTLLGGEVGKLVGYSVSGTDKHAKDVDDGYADSLLSPFQRPILTTTLAGGATEGPLFLTDDGTTNYGTLFGTVVGGNVGQVVSGGTNLGPSTMTGSGKVTCWANPGMYGVTTDAVDTAADGLVVTNGFLSVGSAVSYTSTGKLTWGSATGKVSSARTVGFFVEFAASGSLVTTPRSLTRVGISGGQLTMKYAVINWLGGSL